MRRTRHQPLVLAVGFAAALLVSATACALISRAAPVVSRAPAPERLVAMPAAAIVAERDPFAPLVDVSKLP